jgi:mannose-6-phosphate isomerase-like protein (cupin superfamily)
VSGSSGELDVLGDIRQAYLTMIIHSEEAPAFRQGGTTAIGYASPSRGGSPVSLWRIALEPGESSPDHTLTSHEVFLALEGSASATVDGVAEMFRAGDCLVVPAGAPFVLRAGDEGFAAVCAMRADGRATLLPDGPTLTPPWAA